MVRVYHKSSWNFGLMITQCRKQKLKCKFTFFPTSASIIPSFTFIPLKKTLIKLHKLRFLTGKWVRPRESPVWTLWCSCCRGCGHNRNSLFFVWMSECGSGQKCDSRFSSRSEHDVFDLVGRPWPAEFKQLAIKHRPARKGCRELVPPRKRWTVGWFTYVCCV